MTANVSVSNTTSLYQGSGPVNVLNSTQALYNIFSNSGNVQFSLINANTRISANAINLNDTGVSAGTYGSDTVIPVFTVQADGRVTGVVNTPISGALGSYGNSNVAAYLPTYTGSLEAASSVINLWSNAVSQQNQINSLLSNAATQSGEISTLFTNAATQATAINTINANLGAFETYANATFTVSSYGNANVAAYLPTDPTIIALQSNAATQAVSINTLISNAATQQTQIDGLTSNAASQAVSINALNANLGAFETYANLTFGTSNYANANVAAYLLTNTGNIAAGNFFSDNYRFANGVNILSTIAPSSSYGNANVATFLSSGFGSNSITTTGNIQAGVIKTAEVRATGSGGGTLKNSSGATQASWGAGGGDNFAISVSTNLNGANAQIDISPTGTGHVHIKPTGTGAVEIAPANPGTIDNMVIGNVTPLSANFTTVAATGNVSASYFLGDGSQLTGLPATYGNLDVAAYLPGYSGNLDSINNLTVTGKLFSDDITATGVRVDGDATITGNLFVEGNVTTINSNVITTNDLTITVANNISSASLLTGAGLEAGAGAIATLLYDYTTNSWQSNINVLSTNGSQNLGEALTPWNNVYATTLHGDGSNITGLANNSTIQAIDANLGTATTNISTLFSNAASQQTQIDVLDANLGTATTNITTLFANAATQAGQIQTIDANVGAYETWANIAIGNAYFNGNLRGNTLSDSVLGHVFVNASPYSQPTAVTGGLVGYMTTPVVYTSGALQSQNTQSIGLIATSNVGLQASYQTSTNKTAIGHFLNSQWWPVTANVMNNRDRIRGSTINTEVVLTGNVQWNYSGGGASTTTLVSNGTNMILSGNGATGDAVGGLTFMSIVPVGGSANVRYATGYLTNLGWGSGGAGALASNIEYLRGYTATVSTNASHLIQNAIGLHTPSGWAGTGTTVTRRYALLNEDSLSSIATNGNITATASSGNVWINNGTSGLIYLDTGVGSTANIYARANTMSFVTASSGQTNFSGGNISMTPNLTIGATGTTTNFNGNVIYNGVTNSATFLGNLVTGTVTSYTTLRGTNLIQGNIKFDAPYYETINAMGNQTGTLTINTGICNTFTMTLTGNITLNTTSFTNMITGKTITLVLTQDGTGGRTLTSNLKYANGFKTLSTSPGAIDTITMAYDGTNYLATLVSNYS